MVVVVLPSPKFLLQVVQRDEFMQVKEFITQSTVERFDQPIIRRLSWARVIELDAASVCPVVQRPRREFRSVIYGDCLKKIRCQTTLIKIRCQTELARGTSIRRKHSIS